MRPAASWQRHTSILFDFSLFFSDSNPAGHGPALSAQHNAGSVKGKSGVNLEYQIYTMEMMWQYRDFIFFPGEHHCAIARSNRNQDQKRLIEMIGYPYIKLGRGLIMV